MKVKANFNPSEAIEYMRNGGKLYLDGYEYTYHEHRILDDLSPILMTKGDLLPPGSEARPIWWNLGAVERDESPQNINIR